MMKRRDLRTPFKSRRRSNSLTASIDSTARSSVGSIRIAEAVGMVVTPKPKKDLCKRNIVTSSSPLNVAASTASMSDANFNSSNMEIKPPVMSSPADAGRYHRSTSTPVNNKVVRFDVKFDGDDHSSMRENMLHKNQTFLQLQMNGSASVVSPMMPAKPPWTSTPGEFWTHMPPEKDQTFDDDEFAAFASPDDDDDNEVAALASPVGVDGIDSFTRKRLDGTKTSQKGSLPSLSAYTPPVHDDVVRSLRCENEKLKKSCRGDAADEGTLDEGSGGPLEFIMTTTLATDFNTLDISTLDEGTLATDLNTLDEVTADEGTLDEGTLATSLATASYYSGSEADWDDNMTLESDLDSVTLRSATTPPRKSKRKNARNVKDAGPSSRALRHALRYQGKSGVTSACAVVDEMMGTYLDANNALCQVFNAFFVSFDDVDRMSEVIRGGQRDLTKIHTDRFVPTKARGSKSRGSKAL